MITEKLDKAYSVLKDEGAGELVRRVKVHSEYKLLKRFGVTSRQDVRLKVREDKRFIRFGVRLKKPLNRDTSEDPYHHILQSFVDQVCGTSGTRILELGARSYTPTFRKMLSHEDREYVGFDIHLGPNVDVAGDIHRLSRYFAECHFDFVFSVMVFEHVAMPWKAVLEINKVMKTGGVLLIATTPAWPPHALPWDFWRFNEGAMKVLLNPSTGFELTECSQGMPCSIVPLTTEQYMSGMWRAPAYLTVSAIAKKIGPPDARLCWDVEVEDFLDSTYPEDGIIKPEEDTAA